jgi:sulfite oxidase
MSELFNYQGDRVVHSEQPLNAEPTLSRLRASFRTAQTDFYVRSHGNIPRQNTASYRLEVDGRVRQPLSLSMDDLQNGFRSRTVSSVMQCAGNRRSDMFQLKPVLGELWGPGAIGSAEWTGAGLNDVLVAAGASETSKFHVAFESLDECEIEGRKFRYGVSIPMTKAVSPEVLLAYAMNGEYLTPEHGAPLRVVVPGFAGVRSPKWLSKITVQDAPSSNYMQAEDYKLFPSKITKQTADPSKGVTIDEMPLNSAICEPASNSKLKSGTTLVRGWAVATGRSIARVDVSLNGGHHWVQAEIEHDEAAPWSWTFWQIAIELPKGEHELSVRAWDSAGQTQPASVDDVWNFKGYLCSSWHRIRVAAV